MFYSFKIEDSFTKEDIQTKVKISKLKVIEQLEFWKKQKVLELSATGYYHLIED